MRPSTTRAAYRPPFCVQAALECPDRDVPSFGCVGHRPLRCRILGHGSSDPLAGRSAPCRRVVMGAAAPSHHPCRVVRSERCGSFQSRGTESGRRRRGHTGNDPRMTASTPQQPMRSSMPIWAPHTKKLSAGPGSSCPRPVWRTSTERPLIVQRVRFPMWSSGSSRSKRWSTSAGKRLVARNVTTSWSPYRPSWWPASTMPEGPAVACKSAFRRVCSTSSVGPPLKIAALMCGSPLGSAPARRRPASTAAVMSGWTDR